MKHYRRWMLTALFILMGLFLVQQDAMPVQAADQPVGDYYLLGQVQKRTSVYKKASTGQKRIAVLNERQEIIVRRILVRNEKKWCKIIYQNKKGKRCSGYIKLHPVTILSKVNLRLPQTTTIKLRVDARRLPTDMATRKGTLKKNQKVKILAVSIHNGETWYYVQYRRNGKTQRNYIKKENVKEPISAEQWRFERNLASFPDSYQSDLIQLYQAHPNWNFVPVYTGHSWDEALAAESKTGVNVITSVAPVNGTYGSWDAPFNYLSTAKGAYNWRTDKYTVFDGTKWYAATKEVIAYYMDPRNFLTEQGIYMFESMKYEPGVQDIKGVRAILKNSFMDGTFTVSNGKKKVTYDYAEVFMEAAEKSGVSPYFLAARSLMELGSGGSGSSSGKTGIYNFYNIGANDSKKGEAVSNGLKWAASGKSYMRPWTTPYKSIVGGAKYIQAHYVDQKQYTAYFQKFNVINEATLYWHQYETAVYAPFAEAMTKQKVYKTLRIDRQPLTFYIPVYAYMPEQQVSLPAPKGNTNCFIRSVKITDAKTGTQLNGRLSAKFQYNKMQYTLTVPRSVASVKISAKASSKFSTVTGKGVYTLRAKETKRVRLVCTAQSGDYRAYEIKIKRK